MKGLVVFTVLMSLGISSCSSHKKEEKKKEAPQVSYVGSQAPSETKSQLVPEKKIDQVTSQWSPESKELLDQMTKKYGQPQEASARSVVWYNNGQWSRTVLSNKSNSNMLRQTVSMPVPPEALGELAMYSKNITVDQAQEEVTTSSNKEELNYLSLNLAKEVIDGRMSPFEARRQFSTIASSLNRSRYLDELNFRIPVNETKQSQEE